MSANFLGGGCGLSGWNSRLIWMASSYFSSVVVKWQKRHVSMLSGLTSERLEKNPDYINGCVVHLNELVF